MNLEDIKLDSITHDVDISAGDLQLVQNADEVGQNVKIRLLFFRGEWYLDTSIGVLNFEDMYTKNPDLDRVDALFKAEIARTIGVNELLSYSSEFDRRLRKYSSSFLVNTIYGQITGEF